MHLPSLSFYTPKGQIEAFLSSFAVVFNPPGNIFISSRIFFDETQSEHMNIHIHWEALDTGCVRAWSHTDCEGGDKLLGVTCCYHLVISREFLRAAALCRILCVQSFAPLLSALFTHSYCSHSPLCLFPSSFSLFHFMIGWGPGWKGKAAGAVTSFGRRCRVADFCYGEFQGTDYNKVFVFFLRRSRMSYKNTFSFASCSVALICKVKIIYSKNTNNRSIPTGLSLIPQHWFESESSVHDYVCGWLLLCWLCLLDDKDGSVDLTSWRHETILVYLFTSVAGTVSGLR